MSQEIQSFLNSIKSEKRDPLWDGSTNEWVRKLGSVRSAEMAQLMVCALTEGKPASTYANGYKVISGEDRIEIKLATLGTMGSSTAFMWQGIDMSGEFSHLCLIAIYPDDARLFMVPRSEIDISSMSKLKGQSSKYQLTTRRTDDLFPWMVRREVPAAP